MVNKDGQDACRGTYNDCIVYLVDNMALLILCCSYDGQNSPNKNPHLEIESAGF